MIRYKEATTGSLWMADEIQGNDYLCVIYKDKGYYLCNVLTGKPYLRTKFAHKDLALGFGNFLHQHYGTYFDIWQTQDWAGVDIPLLFQYTIPDGIEIYRAIEQLKEKEIIYDLKSFDRFI